ncbi:hypothetical protein RSOLAG22IIIB_11040 [Rhizoctonia solani]|uniref:Uncharacterized protein n=1 Tax=Rhizoctonia solani TaxID=456999 RepID=A0A0K6G6U4_9AGAM|nr:hypothetical protein RSOLAG22IIIB_11040 [Rhizoctonia solani]
MDYYQWGYFLTNQQIIDLYKTWGGEFGTFDPHELNDIFHARRSIFHYLMPGPIRVWIAGTDEAVGVVFFIGKPNRPIRESVEPGLAGRCLAMFGGPPCPFTLVAHTGGEVYMMKRKGQLYKLDLLQFMQSDTEGDRHPLMLSDILPEQRHLLGL